MKKVFIVTKMMNMNRKSSNSPAKLPSSTNLKRNSKMNQKNEFTNMANLLEIYEKKLLNKENGSATLIQETPFTSKTQEAGLVTPSNNENFKTQKKASKNKEYNSFRDSEIEKTLTEKNNKNYQYLFTFQTKKPESEITRKREANEKFTRNCNLTKNFKIKNYLLQTIK